MKKVIGIASILIVIGIITFIIYNNIDTKFYLDDNYYGDNTFIEANSVEINNIGSKNYILFTHNNYCNFKIPCEQIFKEFMNRHNIKILSIPFAEFKNTDYYKTVKYAPSILIIKNNKIVKYLDAEKDEDIDMYQDVNKFEEWIGKYIYFENK